MGRSLSRQDWEWFLSRSLCAVPLAARTHVHLHETHAALDQAARQQAVAAVARRIGTIESVQPLRLNGFAREIDGVGGAGLHAIGQFISGDARLDGIAVAASRGIVFVQFVDVIDLGALAIGVRAAGQIGVEDRRFAGREVRALVGGRHEAGAPIAVAAGWINVVVRQHHETRQVVADGSQAVQRPRSQRRTTRTQIAGVHLADAGHVRLSVGAATAEDGEVIDATSDFRIPVADPQTGSSMLLESAAGVEQGRVGRAAHRRHRSGKAGRQRFAGQLFQLRLGIE